MTDIRTQKPVASKGSAGGKGHQGSALATVFLREDEAAIRADFKKQDSMKDRLRKIAGLGTEERVEFRATLEEKRAEIRAAAEAKGMKQQDYFKSSIEGRVHGSLNVAISDYSRLSKALDKGWKPDYSMHWLDLKLKATEALDSSGSSGGNKPDHANKRTLVDKTKNFVKGNLLNANGKVDKAMLKPVDVKLSDDKTVTQIPLVESIMLMLVMADAPDAVLDELVAKVKEFQTNRAKSKETAGKATAKARASAAKTPAEKKEIQDRSAKRGSVGADALADEAKALAKG
jgi:hypothetical protein